jgi:hypothetical protein
VDRASAQPATARPARGAGAPAPERRTHQNEVDVGERADEREQDAESDARVRRYTAELVALAPGVILVSGGSALAAVQNATRNFLVARAAYDHRDPKARLAQAIIALANHGGGTVLIGYAEQGNGSFMPAEPRPTDLSGYTTDVVNEISRAYLNPPVHCDVRHVAHPVTGVLFPVINVPGGHTIPIMAKRGGPQGQSTLQAGRTYIRRVGPSSEEPQSPEEWRTLLDRCVRAGREELVDRIRLIVAGEPIARAEATSNDDLDAWIQESSARWLSLVRELPATHPARFPLGYYRFAYQLRGRFDQPSLRQLRDALQAAEVSFSGCSSTLG